MDERMDWHRCRVIDDLCFFPTSGKDGTQPVSRRSFVGLAHYDDFRRFFVAGLWILCGQSFRVCGEHNYIFFFTGAVICKNSCCEISAG